MSHFRFDLIGGAPLIITPRLDVPAAQIALEQLIYVCGDSYIVISKFARVLMDNIGIAK